jgi:hypothetical protein
MADSLGPVERNALEASRLGRDGKPLFSQPAGKERILSRNTAGVYIK